MRSILYSLWCWYNSVVLRLKANLFNISSTDALKANTPGNYRYHLNIIYQYFECGRYATTYCANQMSMLLEAAWKWWVFHFVQVTNISGMLSTLRRTFMKVFINEELLCLFCHLNSGHLVTWCGVKHLAFLSLSCTHLKMKFNILNFSATTWFTDLPSAPFE